MKTNLLILRRPIRKLAVWLASRTNRWVLDHNDNIEDLSPAGKHKLAHDMASAYGDTDPIAVQLQALADHEIFIQQIQNDVLGILAAGPRDVSPVDLAFPPIVDPVTVH